jgi:hypothetical protein
MPQANMMNADRFSFKRQKEADSTISTFTKRAQEFSHHRFLSLRAVKGR